MCCLDTLTIRQYLMFQYVPVDHLMLGIDDREYNFKCSQVLDYKIRIKNDTRHICTPLFNNKMSQYSSFPTP